MKIAEKLVVDWWSIGGPLDHQTLKDQVRIMHSHTTRAQAARPAVSAAAVRQRRLRRACRLVLGRVLALSRAPVVLARRLPRPLTLGLKARARAVVVLV